MGSQSRVEALADDLERRVASLEASRSSGTNSAGSAAPVPTPLLKELLNLRDTLANAVEETKQTEALNHLLKEENAAMKKAQEKADYRVKIMKTSLEEALEKRGGAAEGS